ncbi:MAG: transposase [Candidatus Accumulibacter sp.]|nr:transposase [Accumulibacter sp.]
MRLSMDCKATVKIGDYSRGGKTRVTTGLLTTTWGARKNTPFGVVNEDSGSLHLSFGSSAKTSDFIIDSLYAWWGRQAPEERARVTHLQIKADNGPESNGRRTQFLKRMVQFADHIGRSIRLLYYPPYHSKYNPVERCWGILEKHWNGAKLTDTQMMLEWAKTMTWKAFIRRRTEPHGHEKGVTVAKEAMQAVESRLERHPLLPKWDILIRPVSVV